MRQRYPEMYSGEQILGYEEEQEAERVFYDAHVIACEVSNETFPSEDAARHYIEHRINPFIGRPNPYIQLAATGEGVTVPDLRFMQTEDLEEGSLVIRGMETKDNADIPLIGCWGGFEHTIIKNCDDSGYSIEMAAILALPDTETVKLNDYVSVTIAQRARVILGEDSSIVSVRLDQLRRFEELVMFSSQPKQAQKIKKILLAIDNELQQETDTYRDLQNIEALRALGKTASEMLVTAGDNDSEREEIISLIENGLGIVHRTIHIKNTHGSGFAGKWVASEKENTLPLDIRLAVGEQSMLIGSVLGIVAPKQSEDDSYLLSNIPHLVIGTNVLGHDGDLYAYVPFTKISRLLF